MNAAFVPQPRLMFGVLSVLLCTRIFFKSLDHSIFACTFSFSHLHYLPMNILLTFFSRESTEVSPKSTCRIQTCSARAPSSPHPASRLPPCCRNVSKNLKKNGIPSQTYHKWPLLSGNIIFKIFPAWRPFKMRQPEAAARTAGRRPGCVGQRPGSGTRMRDPA